VRITHATPAAAYAHTANRDWESDKELGDAAAQGCKDIADQLVNWPAGDGFEVAMGGGRSYFLPASAADPEDEGKTGRRPDSRDLTKEWASKDNNHVYVWNEDTLKAVDWASGAKVLGLFEMSHMEYEADRAKDKGGEPSLAEMTELAIKRLQQNDNGFVLMVEGGRIDHAHHDTNAARALIDTVAFDKAVKTALDLTSREDTLIIATADHSHTFFIQGYPKRGNPILGLATDESGKLAKADDGKPYTTLGYANGPGAVFPALPKEAAPGTQAEPAGARADLTNVDVVAIDYRQQSTLPFASETHAGDDVAVFAWGPYAHAFHGVVEQNLIYHVMAKAAGRGQDAAALTPAQGTTAQQ
jgi:alkaline phosphatase